MNLLPDANELVKAMKRAAIDAVRASKPVNVCFGKVVSVSPLQVNIEQKMILGEPQLIFSRNVTNFKTMVTLQGEDKKKEITIHNQLVKGDEVILIRQQGGQKYLVIDRIGVM